MHVDEAAQPLICFVPCSSPRRDLKAQADEAAHPLVVFLSPRRVMNAHADGAAHPLVCLAQCLPPRRATHESPCQWGRSSDAMSSTVPL